jgi:penicillin-binding protein 1C
VLPPKAKIGLAWALSLASLPVFLYYAAPYLWRADYSQLREGYEESFRFYDRNGVFLREAANRNGDHARWLDYSQIPADVIDAVLAAEDERFYSHHGVDFVALARALVQDTTELKIQSGASTLSMQLARLIGHYPRNLFGKILQAYTSRRLEEGLSKDQILCLYVNLVPVGGGSVGMEAGAWDYFGTSLSLLSRSQVAMLAGLIKGPSVYNPRRNLEGAVSRRDYVLDKQAALGMMSASDVARAKKEPIRLAAPKDRPQAMHFTDYLLQGLAAPGKGPQGGDIHTSIDLPLNNAIQSLLRTHIAKVRSGGISDGAVVVLDNRTMEILAMVGSPDYWQGERGRNNGTTALRQPGSTLKPFTYAAAFLMGLSPATVVPDIPTNYIGGEDKLYEPQNYSGRNFGPVLLRDALGKSLNVPAIRVANRVGPKKLLETLHQFGFESLNQDAGHYGLGLTLGDGEVSLLELARGYSVFANKGLLKELTPFRAGPEGSKRKKGVRVMTEDVCYLITDILSDESLRMEAFGVNNPLILEFPIAIKTGTSSNWKDSWVIGYTKTHTIGVWVGNFSGKPTNQYYGAIGAGPLFQQVARLVQDSVKRADRGPIWDRLPGGVEEIRVCPVSGDLPNAHCPRTVRLAVLKTSIPKQECGVHRAVEIDVRNGMIATDKVAPENRAVRVFEYLDPEYQTWLYQTNQPPPPEKPSPLTDHAARVKIVNPLPRKISLP